MSLRDALIGSGLNMIAAQDSHLFKLSGDAELLSSGLNMEGNRLFSIGLAAKTSFDLARGMIVSTTLRNDDIIIDAPLRSFGGDHNVKILPIKEKKLKR